MGHNAFGAVDEEEEATDKVHNEVDESVGDNSLAVETFLVRRDLGHTPHIPLEEALVEALNLEGQWEVAQRGVGQNC